MARIWQGVYRKSPTLQERQNYSTWYPTIGLFWVLDNPTTKYNCLGYVTGTQTWLWPWATTHITEVQAMQELLKHGFRLCDHPLAIGRLMPCQLEDTIVAYGHPGVGVCHFAHYNDVHVDWNSKMGAHHLIAHALTAFSSSMAVAFYAHRVGGGGEAVNLEEFMPIDPNRARPAHAGPAFQAFASAFEQWKQEMKAPVDPILESHSGYFTNLRGYQRMVELGPSALPYLMEALADGIFLLNWAVERIVGQSPPEEIRTMKGEQAVSRWWLHWWDRNHTRYEG